MKTEKVLAVIVIIGLILKFFHIPGGNILTILSMMTISFFYFPLGFYFLSHKKIDNTTVGFSILSGFLLSTLVTGCLFKFMSWTGAMMVLSVGIISCLPIAFIAYRKFTKQKESEHSDYYKNIVVRVAFFGILGLLGSLI
ncbi:hypothetical protein EZL74_00885 [Flavobacterium silvisoli]|uniref:Uncharacterized protein n=1 Tax=Flavobacterium silvisoli TaxID=2529433 RepID=A0A4Q9Z3S6_9FLAO|nr:hypothetical protein [Flavobacterium silvisoli]TBX71088.1 hypothetical protein EZL74_00885 [Flavobacterium silvisoli]